MSASPMPVVAITTYREIATWGVWSERADVLHAAYARSVEGAGAAAVLLPPSDPARARTVLDRVDALIVAGGADVDPARYGAQAHERTAGLRPDRDAWELALLDEAARLDLPTLMICRGMQLEAARVGGELEQHLPDVLGHEAHSPGGPEFGVLKVSVQPGSRLAGLVGAELTVACHHHQAVRTHPGLRATAYADDGSLEAFEAPERSFWVGVQWHPETREDAGLFAGLVAAAGARVR